MSPSRTMVWSSATTMRIIRIAPTARALQGQVHLDQGALVRARSRCGSRPPAGRRAPAGPAGRRSPACAGDSRAKPLPSSRTVSTTASAPRSSVDLDLPGLGVLGDVGERFLERCGTPPWRRGSGRSRPSSASTSSHGDAGALREVVHQPLACRDQPEVVEHQRAQVRGDAPRGRHRGVEQQLHRGELAAQRLGGLAQVAAQPGSRRS